jgi:hypothetical protein
MMGMTELDRSSIRREVLKEHYRQFTSEYLRAQLERISIDDCKTAVKSVLREREQAGSSKRPTSTASR